MTVYNTKYILSAAAGKRGLIDLRLKAGSLTLDEQQATVTGSAQVDFIYASFGMNLNYSTNSAGIDKLYLDGALNDYTTTVSGGVLTLSRTIGTKTCTYKINTTDDVVVFTNGFATAAALASAVASAGSQTVTLTTTENSTSAPDLALVDSTTRVTLQSSGTVTATAQAAKMIVSGSAGVDVVYIKAGARADVSGLGGSMDKVYFTGNWSDYAKTVAGSTIKFARSVNGFNEEVVVAAGTGTLNDRLIFKDGNVGSGAAIAALKTNAGASLLGAGGATGDAAEKSPQAAMASAAITAISHDTGLADLITRDEVQTISGTYTGSLETGDKIQVKVNGVWLDALSTATTASAGVFSVAGAHLASGLNHIEVRTYSPSGATVAGVGKDVTLDANAPAITLSVPASQNTTVNASETGVDVVFPVAGLKVGDVLQLVVGGVPVGSPVTITQQLLAGPGISLNVPKAALTEGDNTVQAVVRNAAGQTDESNPLVIKLDAQIATPDLSLAATRADGSAWTSPAINDEYLNASESQVVLTVEGDPADTAKALRAGDSIQLKKDGALLGAVHTVTIEEAAANRVFLSVAAADLGSADGVHQLTATVSDAAGNSATSAPGLAVTVDRLAPKPILSVSNVTGAGVPVTADATLSDSETSIWLKVEGTPAAQGGAFKQGDVVTLQSHEGVVATPLVNSSTGGAYQATVAADGAPVFILVNKSDLKGGINNLSASAADLAGNKDVSAQLGVTVQNSLLLTNADMTAHLVNQLEVNSQVVLTANAELSAAVAGKFIRFVNVANSGTKLGFDGESTINTQTIEVSDSRFVSIVGNQIFIKPPFDFDFSNNYSIEIDAGAFTSAGGLASTVVTGADGLSFATVTVGGSQAGAVQGQYMADSTGALTNGKKWFSIEGMGSLSSAASLDLSAEDYALVSKDHNAAGGVPRTSDGVGIGNSSFQVNLTQFGSGDLIYVDDAFNDKTQLNDKALTDVRDNGDGTYTVQFNPDATAGADAGVINIVSGASSVEGVRGQLSIDNSRLGTPVSAITRVDGTGAALTDYVLSAHESLTLKVSSAAYKQGDRVQLSFLNGNGLETALGGEYLVNANDVTKGYVTLTIADPAGLGLLEREDGFDNAIFAKVTNTLGAITRSPVLNDIGGVLYDSRLPTPNLSIATGEDATLSPSESSIHLVVSAAGIQLGDVLELKLGDVTLSALTHTVVESDLSSGYTFTVSKSLLASGSNTLSIKATDTSGNVGSGTPLVVTVEDSTNHAPTVSAPLTLSVNEGDASQVLSLLSNASDADAGETATLSFQNVTYTVDGSATANGGTALPAGLTLTGTQLAVDPGNAVFDSLGAGQNRTIVASYQVKDVNNATVNQTATITIAGRNDAPTVSAPLSANILEINSATVVNYNLNLLNNASDPDAGQTATLSIQNPTYTIDGTATANAGTSLPSGVTLSGSTLTVDRTHAAWNDLAVNETRTLVVSYQVKDASNATVNQTATITITGVNDGLTGAPTISGTLTEAQTLTANNGTLADPDGLNIVSYQWHRVTVDNAGAVLTDEAISGATSKTYVLGAADVDKKMYVSITNNDGNGTTTGTNEYKDSVLSSAWVTNFLNSADLSPTAGVQRTSTPTGTTASTWNAGKSLFPTIQAQTDTDVSAIKIVFSGTGFTDATPDTMVLNSDLSLGADQSGTGITLGGISGINFNYVASTKTLLLTHGDVVPTASNTVTPFSAADVSTIANAIKLKLTAAGTYAASIYFGDSGLYHNEAFSQESKMTHTVL